MVGIGRLRLIPFITPSQLPPTLPPDGLPERKRNEPDLEVDRRRDDGPDGLDGLPGSRSEELEEEAAGIGGRGQLEEGARGPGGGGRVLGGGAAGQGRQAPLPP